MNYSKKIKIYFLICIPFFMLLHWLGWREYYYTIFLYDKVLHFLAGASIGLLSIWTLQEKKQKHVKIKSIMLVFLIGIIWEISEYIIDHSIGISYNLMALQQGRVDTFWDIMADLMGGIFLLLML
ncbi:hypothetical protein ISS06_00725 [Patescibacteria group bacterium]|nr:hypothetical protein [Patescibacteria group bacterium]